ncbi:MAG: selenocysteine-specific translation elongation factor, partial [Anaerolineales bacterium]|nr:selenocysteine-specific translation elongation factor [Anaerolineales bacterium]
MYVIGTAGHVDHGKSTLISSLTGINPDRLKEEQERQMTIDLGFAWFTLPSGEEVGIVDVPGHRDFIDNMLAGVGGIDAVLFVIAADEGVMPQSREHFDILKLLSVKKGIIVLNKIDLITDAEWIDLVETDIKKLVRNSFLENAPIVRVSTKKKIGLDELKQKIDDLLKHCEPMRDIGKPRLPIDRIFSLKGFGTIVTGTLLGGSFSLGDQVEILPHALKSRIRGLQNHKKKQEVAYPGNRTAINLVGVEVNQIKRGDVVCLPGHYKATRLIDVEIELLENSVAKLKHNDQLKLFTGTSQTMARVRIIGKNEIKIGETGWAQLVLENEVVVCNKERFIIRRPSPPATIGGGKVLNAHPKGKYKCYSPDVIKRFEALSKGTSEQNLLIRISEMRLTTIAQLIKESDLGKEATINAIKKLSSDGEIVFLEKEKKVSTLNWLMSRQTWENVRKQIVEVIGEFHKKYPLRRGIRIEDCANQIGFSKNHLLQIIEKLQKEKIIEVSGSVLKTLSHKIQFTKNQQKLIMELKKSFNKTPYQPPSVDECIGIIGQDVYNALLDKGAYVQISSNVVFEKSILDTIIVEVTA